MLDQLCAVVEEIAALQAAIDEHGVIIPGARGQLIESPALRALSRSRTTFARLLAQAFPETETKRTKLARAAAQARWRGTPREAR
jgi:hypothetical protein